MHKIQPKDSHAYRFAGANFILFLFVLWSCSGTEPEPKALRKEEIAVEDKALQVRMLEDVPVEDRKYLRNDTSISIPKASKKAGGNSLFNPHKPEKLDKEVHTYYLVAGSFASNEEAHLLVNFFETEGLEAVILPHKNMKRVAIILKTDEASARKQLDTLNGKYEGLIEFWFLHG